MSTRPTLLIVSYHFAPSPLVGAKRFSFLTREFTRLGFDVHVIAHEIRDSAHGREDPSLPLHGKVHRCASSPELPLKPGGSWWRKIVNGLLFRLLAPVGLEYFWARAATRKALEVTRGLPPGVVIATSPPRTALIAGARISKKLGWPLILDYRDPWSAYDWPDWHRGSVELWFAARIEARVVRASAARVLNTPDMREWFEEHFPSAPRSNNHVVPNGFDAVPAPGPPDALGTLRIVHAGEIYGSRSLVPLLEAMRRVCRRHPGRPLQVITFGALPVPERRRIRDAGLQDLIEERPRIRFADLFTELHRAHLLLAVVSDHMTYSTPYKVYDYMAAGRPILGLAPRDAALHELLSESGAGLSAEPQDVAAIEEALQRSLFGAPPQANARIDNYRWSNLARRYLSVIEAVFAPPGKPAASGRRMDTPAGDARISG
jgi:glycosyltransferase involved in cell wall biosynthesis